MDIADSDRDFGLGLRQGIVTLVDHNSAWSDAFRIEATRLSTALGSVALGIEHIGSTAIPTIPAKPILDLMLGIADFERGPILEPVLAQLGYDYARKAGVPNDHVFGKGLARTHLLHVVEYDGPVWHHNLRFRDRLLADPVLARSYAALKIQLAKQHAGSRAAYTAAKQRFIDEAAAIRP